MHFGLNGRQCIGKNMATINIYKLVVTLLKLFKFKNVNGLINTRANNKSPNLISVGVSDTVGGLWVKAKIRDNTDAERTVLR